MSYELKKPCKLNDIELKDIRELTEICNRYDNLNHTFDVDDSFKEPDDINTFLLYNENRLLSYINLFTPKKKEAEVSALTLPEVRKKGLFTDLLKEAKSEIIGRDIPDFLFICDQNSKDGQGVIKHLKAEYEFSEYSMTFDCEKPSTDQKEPVLEIRESKPKDTISLVKLSMISFDDQKEEAENYVKSVFSSGSRTQQVGLYNKKIIGMISVYREPEKFYIHGLCVLPDFRNKGFGGELLNYKVKKCLDIDSHKEIVLEVQTENRGALSIYERSGFLITACYNYFRKPAAEI